MHNEYIKINCIRDVKDKLLLLKYEDIDIIEIRKVLYELSFELIEQVYYHVYKFYQKIGKDILFKTVVEEQLKDMVFVKEKLIEYNCFPGIKTKADLLTYVLAYQVPANYFNEYLYNSFFKSLKNDYSDSFWTKYNLEKYNLSNNFSSYFSILRNTKDECNTGIIDISLEKPINIINKHTLNNEERLLFARKTGEILDNYYNDDFPPLNNPYKDYLINLVDHIKVYQELEKGKQLVKRK